MTNMEECSPCSGVSITEGWARCMGGGAAEATTSPVLFKLLCCAHMVFWSFSFCKNLACGHEGGRKGCDVGHVIVYELRCRCREWSPSPESLSSSQDRSSELTSARLGVRLKSSESDSTSLTLTSALRLWGSSDAPKTKITAWLRCSIMPWKLEEGRPYWMLVHGYWQNIVWFPLLALKQCFCCNILVTSY